ncbi:MAG: hypothetical protein AMQ74_01490 [Candidatus Methanofastidiosum methylothiophilum]|uniref:Uncharacterized protein n=1 Tax=Candidatus Methanofastidiosum methylothiophilum TaxID=1705564 RepID=A0A150IW06_9EURY|nr:MAG: hypothetical protein AMQ74_01490 [Candidatus Methanofastidiosum methylthiophilus]
MSSPLLIRFNPRTNVIIAPNREIRYLYVSGMAWPNFRNMMATSTYDVVIPSPKNIDFNSIMIDFLLVPAV